MDFAVNWGDIALLAIAAFRLTRLLVFDKITEFLRRPFLEEVSEREENGEETVYLVPKGKGFRKWMGELLNCYWCTGIWVSAFLLGAFYYFPSVSVPIILILAVAGIASIIETIISYIMGH